MHTACRCIMPCKHECYDFPDDFFVCQAFSIFILSYRVKKKHLQLAWKESWSGKIVTRGGNEVLLTTNCTQSAPLPLPPVDYPKNPNASFSWVSPSPPYIRTNKSPSIQPKFSKKIDKLFLVLTSSCRALRLAFIIPSAFAWTNAQFLKNLLPSGVSL